MKKVRVILSAEAKEVYTYLVKESPKSKREKAILNGSDILSGMNAGGSY